MMIIKHSTVIDKPLDEVVEYFMLEGKWRDWHQDLIEINLIEGIMLTEGAKYELVYTQATHHVKILEINLPVHIKYEFTIGNIKHELEYKFREHDDHVHFNVTYDYKFNWTQLLVRLFAKSPLTKFTQSEVEGIKQFIESN